MGFPDGEGMYAYHLHIPQRDMMSKASPLGGSPVSFLTVMMYRALSSLDEGLELPVISHVQHQYRQALRAPINLMQSGRGRAYVDAFMKQLSLANIPVSLVGEERYTLCDTVIP